MSKKMFQIINAAGIARDVFKQHHFSEDAICAFEHTIPRAIARGINGELPPLLILWAIIRWEDYEGTFILKECGVDQWRLEKDVDTQLRKLTTHPMDVDCNRICEIASEAMKQARQLGEDYVDSVHVMLALLRSEDKILRDVFFQNNVTYESFMDRLVWNG